MDGSYRNRVFSALPCKLGSNLNWDPIHRVRSTVVTWISFILPTLSEFGIYKVEKGRRFVYAILGDKLIRDLSAERFHRASWSTHSEKSRSECVQVCGVLCSENAADFKQIPP